MNNGTNGLNNIIPLGGVLNSNTIPIQNNINPYLNSTISIGNAPSNNFNQHSILIGSSNNAYEIEGEYIIIGMDDVKYDLDKIIIGGYPIAELLESRKSKIQNIVIQGLLEDQKKMMEEMKSLRKELNDLKNKK